MKVQVKIISDVQKLRYRITKQKELIEYYDQMSYTLGGSDYSRERVDCTRDLRAPFEKWIYKKIDAEEKLKEMESALSIKLEELANKIDQVESVDYKKILTYRYVLDTDWYDMPGVLNYSSSTIYRFHRLALLELKKLIVSDS